MIRNKKGGFGPFLNSENRNESELNRNTREFFSATVDSNKLIKSKQPHANLKLQNKKVFEISFVISLLLLIGTFQLIKQFSLSAATPTSVDITIEVADIPVTEQFKQPPPPVRPSMPIPSEEESIPEDLTIASTDIDLSIIPPPPSPPDEDDELPIFVAYDEPPEIIGGLAALQKYLKYPRLAQVAGLEGIVFVKVLVGVNGKTEKTEIIRAKPANMGFEESAMEAIQKVKWHPAKQRDRKIRVWVSIPVQFKLVSS
ncbi:MAG: energy transducer TonB [bacterium]